MQRQLGSVTSSQGLKFLAKLEHRRNTHTHTSFHLRMNIRVRAHCLYSCTMLALPVLQVKREELTVGQYIPVASNPPICCSLSFVQGKTRQLVPQHVLDKHTFCTKQSTWAQPGWSMKDSSKQTQEAQITTGAAKLLVGHASESIMTVE